MEQSRRRKTAKFGNKRGDHKLGKARVANGLQLGWGQEAMEVLDIQHHQTGWQGGRVLEVFGWRRCHSLNCPSQWAQVGRDHGFSARQERVFNIGAMEETGSLGTWALAQQEQALYDEGTFKEDCGEEEGRKITFGNDEWGDEAVIYRYRTLYGNILSFLFILSLVRLAIV